MDTPSEARQIDQERRLDGKPLLPNHIADRIAEGLRKLNAEKDAHSPYCPMGMVGKISTLCVCAILKEQECQRCHTSAYGCECPEDKRQWV
jgi:hypothetical protein